MNANEVMSLFWEWWWVGIVIIPLCGDLIKTFIQTIRDAFK